MKDNKFITVLIVIIIMAIIAVLGLLGYELITASSQTSNQNVANEEQTNKVVNNQMLNQINNVNNINNEQVENQTIIAPIIDPVMPNENNEDNEEKNESFVSTYYYNQLDETAKAIYDGLKANKENLTSGNYIIDYGTKFNTLLNSDGGEEKLNKAFQSAWDAFSYDNIDLFYIDVTKMTLTNHSTNIGGIKTYKISIGPGNNSSYFQEEFSTQADVKQAQEYLESIKKQIVEQTANDDAYTKVKKIHDWLIYFITYENATDTKIQHTVYGALKNGRAVCEGYAKAFKYLLDSVEVPCVLISGTGTNSQGQTESHAWNYVQIDAKWYGVDVTWNDPIITGNGELTDTLKYKYFLKSSNEFFKDHKEEGNISESGITFKFPILDTENYGK